MLHQGCEKALSDILTPGRGGEDSTLELTFGNSLPAGVGVPRLTGGWGLGRVFRAEESNGEPWKSERSSSGNRKWGVCAREKLVGGKRHVGGWGGCCLDLGKEHSD